MAVFLTGGGGKTSVRIASLLKDRGTPFLLGSRRGEAAAPPGMAAIKFDWLDPSTFSIPFQHSFPEGERISGIYLIAPEVAEPGPLMNAFIDHAVKEHRVKRFVLLAGNHIEPGGFNVGKVWQHLLDLNVEYCVLRPTWFMGTNRQLICQAHTNDGVLTPENFSEGGHLFTIRHERKIYTGCRDGKIPFISADDIAAVAMHCLVDEKAHNTDYRLLGPELLTHDEVAAKLSHVLGCEILHVKETHEERMRRYGEYGLEQGLAQLLAWLEDESAKGAEVRFSDAVEKVTGRPSLTFDAFAQRNKAIWQ
ncbi:hypothetical protein APHAL10511_005362 [Amanita phalloides]|nr:hypothetical protein APHAL10511_005362 [Amanita phalloides]